MLDPNASVFVFGLLTCAIGGLIAFAMGRAIALAWRPVWVCALACVALTLAVRFLHYALFQEPLLSSHGYSASLIVLLALGLLGYRLTRAAQMLRGYGWLYAPRGLFGWQNKA